MTANTRRAAYGYEYAAYETQSRNISEWDILPEGFGRTAEPTTGGYSRPVLSAQTRASGRPALSPSQRAQRTASRYAAERPGYSACRPARATSAQHAGTAPRAASAQHAGTASRAQIRPLFGYAGDTAAHSKISRAPKAAVKPGIKSRSVLTLSVLMLIVFMLTVLVVYRYAVLSGMHIDNLELRENIEELNNQVEKLEETLSSSRDLEDVMEKAGALGMSFATSSQIRYLEPVGSSVSNTSQG